MLSLGYNCAQNSSFSHSSHKHKATARKSLLTTDREGMMEMNHENTCAFVTGKLGYMHTYAYMLYWHVAYEEKLLSVSPFRLHSASITYTEFPNPVQLLGVTFFPSDVFPVSSNRKNRGGNEGERKRKSEKGRRKWVQVLLDLNVTLL